MFYIIYFIVNLFNPQLNPAETELRISYQNSVSIYLYIYPERRVVGQDGLATQIARSVRSNQEGCYDEPKCTIPPGDPERGGAEEIPNRMDLKEANRNVQPTLSRCICGKTCKNQRGLKIHQSRMKCLEWGNREQRAGASSGKTEGVQGQESYHSAQSLQASVPLTLGKESRKKIKWPPANDKGAWQDFDIDICEIIQSATKGDVKRRLNFMTTITTSLASERFGCVELRQPRRPYTANRRVNKMKDLRKEIRSLKKLYRRASIEERQPLEELRGILRGELKTLRRAEWHRRRRKERSRKRTNFLSNPFGFARTLLGEKQNGNLEASEEQINSYLRDTMSDPAKEQDMGINNRLIHQKPPVVQYDTRLPTWKEMQEVARATRSTSAPGPDKIFFSLLSRRSSDFFLDNSYIDTSVQKGGVAGIPGCLEHTGVLTQLLREAKESKGDLTVL